MMATLLMEMGAINPAELKLGSNAKEVASLVRTNATRCAETADVLELSNVTMAMSTAAMDAMKNAQLNSYTNALKDHLCRLINATYRVGMV